MGVTQQIFPTKVYAWLIKRGISEAVITKHKISWDGKRLVIPIKSGNFNKYRRDPESFEGPKYTYDPGSHNCLYGEEEIIGKTDLDVFICEGELDALRLESLGFTAVSSTGGAGSFKPEWANHFLGHRTYICFDNDEAGIKGSYRVLKIIPWAKIIWLPEKLGKGGDITDYLRGEPKPKEVIAELMAAATSYELPAEIMETEKGNKISLREKIKESEKQMEGILNSIREKKAAYADFRHLETLLEIHQQHWLELKRLLKLSQNPKTKNLNQNNITEAKRVPIERFIQFNRQGFAKSIWNNENTPSMFYYRKQNRVYDFSSGRGGDVIDVVAEIYNVDFNAAINIILGGTNGKRATQRP